MRKLLLIVILICGIKAESIAQLQKDSWILEGNLGIGGNRNASPQINDMVRLTTSYSLEPKAGYFVKDNLAIGLSGKLSDQWARDRNNDPTFPANVSKVGTRTYGGGVFIRNYFEIKENLHFFGETGSRIFWSRSRQFLENPSRKETFSFRRDFDIYVLLGLQYLLSPKVGVHVNTNLVQYTGIRQEVGVVSKRSEFQAGFLINPRFGFTIFL